MIWNVCIRRPVLTVVLFLVAGIFGIYGYMQMPVRENPDVEFPIVSVNVVLPGAEPEVVETEVVEPLESEINTIEGIKELSSTAREQVAEITAEFELWRDIDVATQDVRDRVSRARRELPDDIEEPIVRKIDPDAQAVIWIALTGDARWDAVRLSNYAADTLREQIENLRGVGQVLVGGERRYAARVRIDPQALATHHVTMRDVVRTIQNNNVDIPSGRVEGKQVEFLVDTRGQFRAAEPLNDLIVRSTGQGPVRIGDVGQAVPGVENDRQLARFRQKTAVGLGIVKQSDANTVAVSNQVRARIAELATDFPAGLKYTVAADDSSYVEDNIDDLWLTILLATALVVAVVLLLLRSVSGTVVTSLAIPTSLLIGVAAMNAFGFSLNVLSMLALILVIGIVVDDAIVVLESCYRHLEQGAERVPAARTGTTEVAFATIANSLSLAAVFIPVAFTTGLIGRFFLEFGVTVTVTIFASTLTALTLTPMLCSRLLRLPERPGRITRGVERAFERLERGYRGLLELAFRRRWATVLAGLALLATGLFFFRGLSREFQPVVDRSQFMIRFETPEGSTLRETNAFAANIEEVLHEHPAVSHQFLVIGLAMAGPGEVSEGICFVHLTPRGARAQHQEQVMQKLRERLGRLPGGEAYVMTGAQGPQSEAPLQIVLQHPELDVLARRQQDVLEWMRRQPELIDVRTDLNMSQPQVDVDIHRDKASELGVSVADISETLRFLLGEPDISEIERGAERYEVIPEVQHKGHMVPRDLRRLYVRTSSGEPISLANVVDLDEVLGPSEIHHFDRIRAASLSASTPPGVTLGDALTKVQKRLNATLPARFDYEIAGTGRDFEESFRNLTMAVSFSIVFVFLVLAAQFESWIHPATVMLSLPLATVGAFAGLWAFGMNFNIFSFIGLIMLLGMASKNAILLVDYANVLVRRGYGVIDAAKHAAHVRFRPVLMTTVSTAMGLVPIAVGFGAGGRARMPLGVAVIFGLLATTLLTLVLIPVVYTLMDRVRLWLRSHWDRLTAVESAGERGLS